MLTTIPVHARRLCRLFLAAIAFFFFFTLGFS